MAQLQELFCCENSMDYGVKKAFEDPVLLKDDRVLLNLLATEDKYLPSPSYFQCVQTDIAPWMRIKVSQWILEVCEEQQCEMEVFPLAVNYMDRFLSVVNIGRSQLQLLGATCMFIAAKLKQTLPLSAEKLVIYTDRSISMSELMQWECYVLSTLRWDLSAVTPHDFLEQILCRLPLSKQNEHVLKRHAQSFIAMCCATEFHFALYPASMIAASSVSAAASGLLGATWTNEVKLLERLQHITNIDGDCLQACQEQMEKLLTNNLASSSSSVSSNGMESRDDVAMTSSKAGVSGSASGTCTTPTDVRDIWVS